MSDGIRHDDGMTTTNYTASIYDASTDGLVEVDIRGLSADRLAALKEEAGSAGDADLVAAIDSLA